MATKNVRLEVPADRMAPFFLLDKSLEELPEPFRLQESLTIVIPFSEYKVFIRDYLKVADFLRTPTKVLRKHLEDENDIALFSCFSRDMAFAVTKEIYYAYQMSKTATTIIHSIETDEIKTTQDITNLYRDIFRLTEDEILATMAANDFNIPIKAFSGRNQMLWEYANVLQFKSRYNNKPWIFDI